MYVKARLADGVEIKVEITHENVFAVCPNCGQEHEIQLWEIVDKYNALKEKAGSDYPESDPVIYDDYLCGECIL